jgi:sulfonate dioxygenase
MVRTPPTAGDTIYTTQVALFDKLSPTFQKTFEGLYGIHSSQVSPKALKRTPIFSINITELYLKSINGGDKPHRAPITTEHPLVHKNIYIQNLKEANPIIKGPHPSVTHLSD